MPQIIQTTSELTVAFIYRCSPQSLIGEHGANVQRAVDNFRAIKTYIVSVAFFERLELVAAVIVDRHPLHPPFLAILLQFRPQGGNGAGHSPSSVSVRPKTPIMVTRIHATSAWKSLPTCEEWTKPCGALYRGPPSLPTAPSCWSCPNSHMLWAAELRNFCFSPGSLPVAVCKNQKVVKF